MRRGQKKESLNSVKFNKKVTAGPKLGSRAGGTERKPKMQFLTNISPKQKSRGRFGPGRADRRPSGVLWKLTIVAEMTEAISREFSTALRGCKCPRDLDTLVNRLRRVQQRLAHSARRLDLHLSRHEGWLAERQ